MEDHEIETKQSRTTSTKSDGGSQSRRNKGRKEKKVRTKRDGDSQAKARRMSSINTDPAALHSNQEVSNGGDVFVGNMKQAPLSPSPPQDVPSTTNQDSTTRKGKRVVKHRVEISPHRRGLRLDDEEGEKPPVRPCMMTEGTGLGMPDVQEPLYDVALSVETSASRPLPSMAPPRRPSFAKSDHPAQGPNSSARISGRYRQKMYKYDQQSDLSRPGTLGSLAARLFRGVAPENPETYFERVGPEGDILSPPDMDEVMAPGAVSVDVNDRVIRFRNKGQLTSLNPPQSHDSEQARDDTQAEEFDNEMLTNSSFQEEAQNRTWWSTKRFQIVFCITIIAAATAFAVIFTTNGGGESVDSSEEREEVQVVSLDGRQDAAHALATVISGSQLLDQVGTPQNLALDWIVNDDHIVSKVHAESLGADLTKMARRYALAVFFFATGGESMWTITRNWLSTTLNECEWKFISCNDAGDVVEIDTGPSGNSITGELPSELGVLSSLETVSLRGNSISDLPMELRSLVNLTTLRLDKNAFENEIPSVVYELTSLDTLIMGENSIHGSISPKIENLSRLTNLDLFINRLSGTIPISSLSSLESLVLASNNLDGNVSTIIMGLPDAEHINLSYNSLVGSIPTEIGTLRNLVSLTLDHIALKSTIPTEIGLLTNLTSLALTGTQVEGTIPSELRNLSNLGMSFQKSTTD